MSQGSMALRGQDKKLVENTNKMIEELRTLNGSLQVPKPSGRQEAQSAAVASHMPSYAIKYDLSGEEMCWATAQAHSLMSGCLLASCDLPPDMAGSLAASINEAVDKAVNDWLRENAGDEPWKKDGELK